MRESGWELPGELVKSEEGRRAEPNVHRPFDHFDREKKEGEEINHESKLGGWSGGTTRRETKLEKKQEVPK